MTFEGGFQGRTNKLVDGCYSFWVGALIPLIQAVQRGKTTRDSQGYYTRFRYIYINLFEILDINSKHEDQLFDTSTNLKTNFLFFLIIFHLVAAQEYVLLCCQSNQTGGFTDRPKMNGRYKELLSLIFFLSKGQILILVVVIFIIHVIV